MKCPNCDSPEMDALVLDDHLAGTEDESGLEIEEEVEYSCRSCGHSEVR